MEWCDRNEEQPVSVPCGKCIPCLMNKRQEWSFRLEQEFKFSNGALFVTLTYDPKHCPNDGSLNKRHVQLFLKRLRKKDESNRIRYYCVGEYGSYGGRPHYHLLLFSGNEQHVRQAWVDSKGDPIGIVHVGSVTSASVAYCTKYIVQPEVCVEGFEKPFCLMSRRYGIGGRYLSDDMVAWHRDNEANYSIRDGLKVRLSRFYRSKIWYDEQVRSAISEAGKLLVLQNSLKEEKYYKSKHGDAWQRVMIASRDAVISRVKQKVAYTQTF